MSAVVLPFVVAALAGTPVAMTIADSLGNLSDADVAAWPKAIARLRAFDARIVIPGHGTSFDPALLDRTDQLLRAAR